MKTCFSLHAKGLWGTKSYLYKKKGWAYFSILPPWIHKFFAKRIDPVLGVGKRFGPEDEN